MTNFNTQRLVVFLFTLLTSAFASAAPLKSDGKVHTKVQGSEITVTTDSGFHLNKDAPADLVVDGSQTKIQPHEKTEKRFKFKAPDKSQGGVVNIYVCDDAKTVCEPQNLNVKWGNATSASLTKPTASNDSQSPEFQKILATAQKSNKLVLVDFSARWCPPCIRLENEVFNTKEFKAIKSKYVFFQVDVDKESNYDLMKTYSVKAFPTMVVVNGKGEVLERYLDFQQKKPFIADLNRVFTQKNLTMAELWKKAKDGNKTASLQIAENYYKSLQYKEAQDWFEKTIGLHYWESKVARAEEMSEEDEASMLYYRFVLAEAVAAAPESFQSLDWRLALIKNYDEKNPLRQKFFKDLLSESEEWIRSSERINQAHAQGYLTEIAGLEVPEVYSRIGDAYQLMGQEDKYKEAYEKAVQATLATNPTEKTPTQTIYLIAYMKPVRPLEDIEPWVEKLEKAFPNEFTYVQRHAKLLLEKKQPAKALPIAEKAYQMSYGNNKFTSGLILAQAKNELQQKSEAKSLVNELLGSEEAKSPRNKRAVKNLEDYLKKI